MSEIQPIKEKDKLLKIPEPVPLPYLQRYDVPLFLRASRLQLFAATEKKVLTPLVIEEQYKEADIILKVPCAHDVDTKTKKDINLGRLNDFDYRVWTIIKKSGIVTIFNHLCLILADNLLLIRKGL